MAGEVNRAPLLRRLWCVLTGGHEYRPLKAIRIMGVFHPVACERCGDDLDEVCTVDGLGNRSSWGKRSSYK